MPEGFCVAVNGEKFWARNQRRYKRYVAIPDVVISEVYCRNMSTDTADSLLASTEAARTAYMRRDGLPYWVERASAASQRKREKKHFFLQVFFFFAGWPSTGEWRKTPHPRNVLNTPLCWQLQKSEDLHPSNSSDPSCTKILAVRDTGEGEAYSTIE